MDVHVGMRAFCAVVEAGSLSKAAIRLGVSKSMMSRRVEQLEQHFGKALFHRSPGLVTLSESGRDYYAACSEIVGRIDALRSLGSDADAELTGRLVLQVLPGLALGPFAKALSDFCALHPAVGFDITVSDALVDPVREGFDLIFHIYPAVNDMLIERKLFPHPGMFCASPHYLAGAAPLACPEDMLRHRFARYANYPWGDRWPFQRGDECLEVELVPTLRTNSVQLLVQYVLNGSGVAYLPAILAAEHVRAGRLVTLLPDFTPPELWMYAIYPPSHRSTAKVRAFLDFIVDRFSGPRDWELENAAS